MIELRVMPGRIVPSGGVKQRTVIEHEEDVHAAEFLDVAALDRIEENDLIAAAIDRLGLRAQARGPSLLHLTAPVPPIAARVGVFDTQIDTGAGPPLKDQPTGEAMTAQKNSADGFTPRKTSLATTQALAE